MLKRISLAIVVLLSAFILLSIGCSSEEDSNGSQSPGATGTISTALLHIVPDDAKDFTLFDVRQLRQDSDLEDIYAVFSTLLGPVMTTIGLDLDDVNIQMECENDVMILDVSSDLDEVAAWLEQLFPEVDSPSYSGVRLFGTSFESASGTVSLLVALAGKDTLISGAEEGVKDCLEVLQGNKLSLSDDPLFATAVSMLPSGFMIRGSLEHTTDPEYAGLNFSVLATAKKDSQTLTYMWVYSFSNSGFASDSLEQLRESKTKIYKNITALQDQAFVVVTADRDIADLLESDLPPRN